MTTHCTSTALAAPSLSTASLAAAALATARDCATNARPSRDTARSVTERLRTVLSMALRGLAWPLRAGARHLRTWLRRREDRAAFQATLALDDHLLDDIGVTREDVLWANRLPLSESAAEALQARAYSNRHYL